MTTRAAMDEQTFLNFYRKSVCGYSKKAQRKLCKKLLDEGKITFESQMRIQLDGNAPIFFEKNDPEAILSTTTMLHGFMGFFERWEYIKLYKYSVPVFYHSENSIKDILETSKIKNLMKKIFLLIMY